MSFILCTFSYICVNIIQLNKTYKESDVQILIATMNRTNFDFLNHMFVNCDFNSLSVLIVNQTSPDRLLKSNLENIKIINSFEVGLSKSRNLAVKNADKDILVIADDDIVYLKGFINEIISAYNNCRSIVHCFQTVTFNKKLYSNYPKRRKKMNRNEIKKVLSIEVTFLREEILKRKIFFNEFFGLGSVFEDGETFFFLRNCYFKRIDIFFSPLSIVKHKEYSSSDEVVSDRLLYAKMGGFCKLYGNFAYFFLLKFVLFLFRKGIISFKGIIPKLKKGSNAINDYKMITKQKIDKKYE